MMDKRLRVLLVEDNEEDALLLERELRRGGFDLVFLRVDTAEALQNALEGAIWDVILSDYSLPSFTGLEAFEVYQSTGLDLPFIIVSGTIGEDLAVEAMKAGVNDYVLKGNLTRLVPAIQRELRDAADRAARRLAEEQLKQNERLRMIGELTASLIHDLRNPFQSILSATEFLCFDESQAKEKSKYKDIVERQIQRVMAMSEDVLDFARGNVHLTLKSLHPVKVTQEIVDTYAPGFANEGVTLTCATTLRDSRIPTIMADEAKVWRVLQNLISNAKDAMPDGGSIRLDVRMEDQHVVVDVADSGKGIPVEIEETLFKPFVTSGKRGTGLGLAIVKNIVDAHGGSVSFTAGKGKGTTFHVSFPIEPIQMGTNAQLVSAHIQ